MKKRIGLAAALKPIDNVHTDTFLRSLEFLRRIDPSVELDVQFSWQTDEMCFEGGRRAAFHFLEEGVDAVVGHFSSRAALGALPLYKDAGVPVILPASTSDEIEPFAHTASGLSAFRMCRPEHELVTTVTEFITSSFERPVIVCSGEQYATSLRDKIEFKLGKSLPRALDLQTDLVIILGHFAFVTKTLTKLADFPLLNILLIDDGAHDSACTYARRHKFHMAVNGLRLANDQWRDSNAIWSSMWREKLPPFALESIVSLQIATQIAREGCRFPISPAEQYNFKSLIGEVTFNDKGILDQSFTHIKACT